MINWSTFNFHYFRTPMGAVKLINVIIEAISLILVATSYVPLWTLVVFIIPVTTCMVLSILHLVFYLVAGSVHIYSKANRVTSFVYHVLACGALIFAGIELIGWAENTDPSCKHETCKLYFVGAAKTLTFLSGILHLIIAFLGIKDDDLLDPEGVDEDVPLLSSSIVLASVPGSKQALNNSIHNSSQAQQYYYDNFFRQPSYSSSWQQHRPSTNQQTSPEYYFGNSYKSTTSSYHPRVGGVTFYSDAKTSNGKRIAKNYKATNRSLASSIISDDV